MKKRLNRVIVATALVTLALPVLAVCYVEDSANNTNCSTASVSLCQSTFNGNVVNGTCNNTVNKPRINSAESGWGVNSGVQCSCSCVFTAGGETVTAAGQVGSRIYDQLNNNRCPS
ncbi:MAG TPA: hypothetical protein VGF13_16160 [Verrucomicrobiae bacterium]